MRPPRLELTEADIQPDLDRRRPGQSRIVSPRQEADRVQILSGTFERKIDSTAPGGSEWNWASGKYEHSFLKRFKAWKDDDKISFIRYPRGAFGFWSVAPRAGRCCRSACTGQAVRRVAACIRSRRSVCRAAVRASTARSWMRLMFA